MQRVLCIAIAAALLGGCGARTDIEEGSGGAASSSTATGTAGGAAAGGGGAGGCTWALDSKLVDIGVTAGNQSAIDAAVEGDRAFVTFWAHQTIELRSLPADLSSLGTVHEPGANVGAFAIGPGTRMLIGGPAGWKGSACVAVRLDEDGAPIGAPQPCSGSSCYFPAATPTGAVVFAAPPADHSELPATLNVLDSAASVVATQPSAIPTTGEFISAPLARAALADGTVLAVWADHLSAYVRAFGPDGTALFEPKPLFPVGLQPIVAIGSLGASAIVAWSAGGTAPDSSVYAAPLSKDGVLGAPQLVVPEAAKDAPSGLDVVPTASGALVVFGSFPPALGARAVDELGRPTAPSIARDLSKAEYADVIRAVPTAQGALIVVATDGRAKILATIASCH